MIEFAVVIPAYNEEKTIRDVVLRVLVHCGHVIVVDDGSRDGTAEAVRDLPVILLQNAANQGKASSLWRGMQAAAGAGARIIITMDADGQHQPEDIPRFLEASRDKPQHIVIGSRLADKSNFPVVRYYANRVANFWVSWASGYHVVDSQCGFRLYPATLLQAVSRGCKSKNSFVFESEILIEAARCGVRSIPVTIAAIYPCDGRPSHYQPLADTARITRMIAWKLLSRGLYLQGLVKICRRSG
jgi:glycosyltransferase involved in cell wall biosynthesis